MRRLFDMPLGRALTVGAAVMFGVFFIAGAVATGYAGRDGVSVVAGVLAYCYLAFALVLVVRRWINRPKGAERAVRRYLEHHKAMEVYVGRPVRITMPEAPANAPGQVNLVVEVAGPRAGGTVHMNLAKLTREWEILSAVLLVDGERVPLTPGQHSAPKG